MEHNEFQLQVIESLTRLETHMQDLMGNGKPGRVKELENSVESLNKWRWIIAGGVLAISALVHFIFRY